MSVSLHVDADLTGRTASKGFTVGNQIVINPKEYAPGTPSGDELIRHELVHVAQQGQATALGGAPSGLIQREPADSPCGPLGFNSPQLYGGAIPGGPFQDQRIAIPYDLIVPLSDPMADFDPAESRNTFNDPARLEQVYHDATQPVAVFANRWRAAWWVCSIVEPVARKIGADHAAELYSIGCLTLKNCGVDFNVMLGNFSDRTASGLRLRALIMSGFVDKSRELNADLTIINNALLLLGGITAARGALGGVRPPPTELRAPPLPEAGVAGESSAGVGGGGPSTPTTQPAPTPPASATRPRQIPQQQQHQIPGVRIHPPESPPHDTSVPAEGSHHQRQVGQQQQLTKKDPPKPPEASSAPHSRDEDITPPQGTRRRQSVEQQRRDSLNRRRDLLKQERKHLAKLRHQQSQARATAEVEGHKAQNPPPPPASRPPSTDPRVNPGPKVAVDKNYAEQAGKQGIKTHAPDESKQAAERAARESAEQQAARLKADTARKRAEELSEAVRKQERDVQKLEDEVQRLEEELEPDTDPDIDPHHE
jgi:Domain of unknown function (DUF4157)